MEKSGSGGPAQSRVDDLADADVGRYIQDVDDADIQDLDYSLAIDEYNPYNGLTFTDPAVQTRSLTMPKFHPPLLWWQAQTRYGDRRWRKMGD